MSLSSIPKHQGWLMKQNHGLNKSWQRRYFVLEGRQLRYYRSEVDTIPQTVLDLDHYTILTDVVPVNSLKRETPKINTFLLMSDDQQNQNDYFLQAESEQEMTCWIDSLQKQVPESATSVLDKWLEWVDIHTGPVPPHHASSSSSLLSPKDRPLRSHRSAESISSSTGSVSSTASFSTAASDCHNDRRPSNQSTTSINSSGSSPANKFFSSRLFSRRKSKRMPPPALTTPAPQSSFSAQSLSSHTMATYSSSLPLISPIIHPSEYNRDDDDQPSENLHRKTPI